MHWPIPGQFGAVRDLWPNPVSNDQNAAESVDSVQNSVWIGRGRPKLGRVGHSSSSCSTLAQFGSRRATLPRLPPQYRPTFGQRWLDFCRTMRFWRIMARLWRPSTSIFLNASRQAFAVCSRSPRSGAHGKHARVWRGLILPANGVRMRSATGPRTPLAPFPLYSHATAAAYSRTTSWGGRGTHSCLCVDMHACMHACFCAWTSLPACLHYLTPQRSI